MDSQNYHYPGFPYAHPTMEDTMDTVFQPQPYPRVDDGHFSPAMNHYLDPKLQSHSPAPGVPHWEAPQVKRYLTDDQNSAYFNPGSYSGMMNPTLVARPSLGTHPVPPQGQFRFASPMSSSDYPMTVPSPTPDRESYTDNNNLPSTPSDTALLSPYPQPTPFEFFSPGDNAIQFGNMGPAIPSAYVKPEDVNPSQHLDYFDPEVGQSDFTLEAQRGYSFGSGSSEQENDQARNQITVAFQNKRMATPEEMELDAIVVKQERRPASHYPLLPGPEDDEDTSDVPEERIVPKRKKDEDPEFLPGKKPRTSATSPRKTRPKQVPARPRSAEASAKSRPRPKAPTKETSPNTQTKTTTSSSSGTGKTSHTCPHCDHVSFKDGSALESHIKKQHTRPFICVFQFAGCPSNFASKNEWKRHCSTQHLVLQYWHCTEGACAKNIHNPSVSSSPSSSKSKTRTSSVPTTMYTNAFNSTTTTTSSSLLTHGAMFNRKDLYTQHLRRMHTNPNIKKILKQFKDQSSSSSSKKSSTTPSSSPADITKRAWEEHERTAQEKACKERVRLPTYMRCPAGGCGMEFKGPDAWDGRMEHVAKHLESGDCGEVVFGGEGDGSLMEWVCSEGVDVVRGDGEGGWVLNDPLKRGRTGSVAGGNGGGKKGVVAGVGGLVVEDGDGDEERDAEGEEDDDV